MSGLPSKSRATIRNGVDDERRKTLLTLVELAEGWDAAGCWDPERAITLLRGQSSAEELRSIGISDEIVSRIWTTAADVENR